MRLTLSATAKISFYTRPGRSYLHLSSGLGSKTTLRKQSVVLEEGARYNVEWLNKVIDGLDKNIIRGRGDSDYFIYIIRLCGQLRALAPGRRIHEHLIQMGIAEELPMGRYIVHMYLKCGSLTEARKLFNLLPSRDITLWTSIISAYAKHERWQEVIKLFELMEDIMRPAKITYIAVMKAFSSPESLPGARLVHHRIVEIGGDSDGLVKAALIEMYGSCGSLEDARKIFNSILTQTVVSWKAIISAYVNNGQLKGGLELFWEMQRRGVRPDNLVLTASLKACQSEEEVRALSELVQEYGYESDRLVNKVLVHMYGKYGCLKEAKAVFNGLSHKNVSVWSSMITAYSEHGFCKEGFLLLKEMHSRDFILDSNSCIQYIEACGSLLALEAGQAVHSWISKKGLEQDTLIGNSLIEMYGKCGSIEYARTVFDMLQERNWFTWNSLVGAYTYSGHSLEAIYTFLQMLQEGVKPNTDTFRGVLTACGHAGFVYEGILLMTYMTRDYGVLPTYAHYACLVSLLGRPGWLKEAEGFIQRVDDGDYLLWDAFLAACRVHGDLERGKVAAEHILELSGDNGRSYQVLAGIYDALGRTEDAEKVRLSMRSKGLSEECVTSAIVIDNTGCEQFVMGDTSHRRIERIYTELEELTKRLQEEGYTTNNKQLLMHEVREEQQQVTFGSHSERLALGLGIIKTNKTPLRIIRNARICKDCHMFFKLSSKALNRTIIVRDGGVHLHRFVQGACSCKDYW